MFCSGCGKATPAGSQYCGGCGAELAPSLQATDFPQASPPRQVALWNPYAIWLWSLLFGTAFGSFLHAKNWQSLGQNDKAKEQYAWFIAGCLASLFAIVGVYFFVDDQARGYRIGTGVQFITLMAWYFLSGRHHGDFIKKTYSGRYQRRPWLGAIAIAVTLIVLVAFASELLHPSETEKPSRSTVSPEVTTASINNVTVESAAQKYETQSPENAAIAAADTAALASYSSAGLPTASMPQQSGESGEVCVNIYRNATADDVTSEMVEQYKADCPNLDLPLAWQEAGIGQYNNLDSNPGFDCANASSAVETQICRDPYLGELDRNLTRKYKQLRAANNDDDALQLTQRRWVGDRNSCTDRGCLVKAYQDRIHVLDVEGALQ